MSVTQDSTPLENITNASIPVTQATGTNLHTVVDSGAVTATISGTPTVTVGNASLAVTGTFYQTTQPVSIADGQDATEGSVADTAYVSGSGSVIAILKGIFGKVAGTLQTNITNASLAVTGTFWQATQPVSITTLPALSTGANAIGSITNTSFTATQATGTNLHAVIDSLPALVAGSAAIGTVGVTSLPALAAGTNSIGTVALQGDFITSGPQSVDVTLSATPNTVSNFAIPTTARGFRIIAPSARVKYGLVTVPATATTSATANTTAALAAYNSVPTTTGIADTRLFQPGSIPATLYFASATASATLTLEFF